MSLRVAAVLLLAAAASAFGVPQPSAPPLYVTPMPIYPSPSVDPGMHTYPSPSYVPPVAPAAPSPAAPPSATMPANCFMQAVDFGLKTAQRCCMSWRPCRSLACRNSGMCAAAGAKSCMATVCSVVQLP